MRTIKNILILVVTLHTACYAQTDTLKKHPFVKFYSGSVNCGTYLFSNYTLNREQLQAFSPNNQLLRKDISAYTYMQGNQEQTGFCMGSSMSVLFYNKKRQSYNKRQEFHFGVSYQSNEQIKYSYSLKERVPFDTLRSNTSTNIYYIDTAKTSWYHYSNYRDNILFNVAHTFHTKPNKIASAYIGYSLCYGRIINNITTVEYYYYEKFEDQNHATYDYTQGERSRIEMSERSVAPNGNIFQVSVPIGGLIRFSNVKKNYLKKLALNLDTQTGIRLTQIRGGNNITQAFFNINFGIKYFLNREAIR